MDQGPRCLAEKQRILSVVKVLLLAFTDAKVRLFDPLPYFFACCVGIIADSSPLSEEDSTASELKRFHTCSI